MEEGWAALGAKVHEAWGVLVVLVVGLVLLAWCCLAWGLQAWAVRAAWEALVG